MGEITDARQHRRTAYALVNGTFGVKWKGGPVTTLVRVTNLLNQSSTTSSGTSCGARVGEVRLSL